MIILLLGIFTFLVFVSVVLLLVVIVVAFLVLLLSGVFLLVIAILLVLVAVVLSGAATVLSFAFLFPIVGSRDPHIQRSQHGILVAVHLLFPVQILTVPASIISIVADAFVAAIVSTIASFAISVVIVFIGASVVLSIAKAEKRSTVDGIARLLTPMSE